MWIPWIGDDFDKRRLLMLGQSAYGWLEDKVERDCKQDHSRWLVEIALADEPERNSFMKMVTQGLCGEINPTLEQARRAWATAAYTNFIPVQVSRGPRISPSKTMWQLGASEWPSLLESIKPLNVIVLGLQTWRWLPPPISAINDVGPFTKDPDSVRNRMRTYHLADGSPVRCFLTWHPASGGSRVAIDYAIKKAEAV